MAKEKSMRTCSMGVGKRVINVWIPTSTCWQHIEFWSMYVLSLLFSVAWTCDLSTALAVWENSRRFCSTRNSVASYIAVSSLLRSVESTAVSRETFLLRCFVKSCRQQHFLEEEKDEEGSASLSGETLTLRCFKTHERLKERFLIRRNRTKRAHFRGNPLFQATYNNTTENN